MTSHVNINVYLNVGDGLFYIGDLFVVCYINCINYQLFTSFFVGDGVLSVILPFSDRSC